MSTLEVECKAAARNVSITQCPNNGNVWTLDNGRVQLTVDAAKGRITSYGLKGGRNLLWVNTQPEDPRYLHGEWRNYGGDKIWPWPQDYWGWPPPEFRGTHTISLGSDGQSLQMTSGSMQRFDVKVIRQIELAPDSSAVTITSRFSPLSTNDARPLAVWAVTQVPTAPRTLVRIPLAADRQRYLTRKPDGLLSQSVSGSIVEITHPGKGGKTFMEADLFAAVYDDVVFLQRQVTMPEAGAWASDERAQIYFHRNNAEDIPPGQNYTELEWTAPLNPLSRLETAPLRIVWEIAETEKDWTTEQVAQWMSQLP